MKVSEVEYKSWFLPLLISEFGKREGYDDYYYFVFFLHAFQLTIHISDENDNPPIFSQDIYTKTIPENVPLGYSVIQVNTSDADVGINADHTFTITGMSLSVYIGFKDPEPFVDFSTSSYNNFSIGTVAAVRGDVVVTLFMYL